MSERVYVAFKRPSSSDPLTFRLAVECCVRFTYVHVELVVPFPCNNNNNNKKQLCRACQWHRNEIERLRQLQNATGTNQKKRMDIHTARLSSRNNTMHYAAMTSANRDNVYLNFDKPFQAEDYDFLILPLPAGSQQRVLKFFEDREGCKWRCSFFQQCRWVLRVWCCCCCCFFGSRGPSSEKESEPKEWYCSEIVAAALKNLGMEELEVDNPDILYNQLLQRFPDSASDSIATALLLSSSSSQQQQIKNNNNNNNKKQKQQQQQHIRIEHRIDIEQEPPQRRKPVVPLLPPPPPPQPTPSLPLSSSVNLSRMFI